ncbi:MAG: single-stranded-DNA-specific exonuclease RecJ [Lachnospiraceae bacterium]|nr:single-stranded-DNA-specific exonuclease RecJ [Lachnospiraceae bacterium]
MEKWIQRMKKADFFGLSDELGVSAQLVRLMVNRGLTTAEEMREYLHPDLSYMHSPFSMKHIVKGARIAKQAIDEGQSIVIASDFDVDGVFSAYILYRGIKGLGGSVSIDTPDRVSEGYGLNRRIVDDAAVKGAGLIITCDNGIAACDAVTYAKAKGIAVVVTDHHEVQFKTGPSGAKEQELPPADAVIDPKQEDCSYPYKDLCGAGVAYKFIQVLYSLFDREMSECEYLLEYAAVATIADVMPLTGENRIIVKFGLEMLNATKHAGLLALIKETGLEKGQLTAYHIGFIIGPCFNAAGRIATVKEALELLTTEDPARAAELAQVLKNYNDERKQMTDEGVKKAFEILDADEAYQNEKVLVIDIGDCHESIAGIVAGRVKERYNKPSIVLTETEGGMLKGSGRSIDAYDMFAALSEVKDIFDKFGGHKMAAGMSLKKERFDEFRKRVNGSCTLTDEDLVRKLYIDIALPVQYATEEFINEMDLMEPYGPGNEKPVFAEASFRVSNMRRIGQNGKFLRLWLINKYEQKADAVYFGDPDAFDAFIRETYSEDVLKAMYNGRSPNEKVAFAYYPQINEFRGNKTVQIVIRSYCHI